MENQVTQRRPHVVLVPAPLQGHLSPMLELGTLLHSKGFSIIIAHAIFNSPDPSNHPEFTFLPIPDNLSAGNAAPANLLTLITTMNSNCEAPLREILAQLMNKNEQHDQICCIVYDMIMYCSGAVAEQLQLPCMILRTSSASAAVAYESLPRLYAEGYIPLQGMSSNYRYFIFSTRIRMSSMYFQYFHINCGEHYRQENSNHVNDLK